MVQSFHLSGQIAIPLDDLLFDQACAAPQAQKPDSEPFAN
jgi:hypothetical protein